MARDDLAGIVCALFVNEDSIDQFDPCVVSRRLGERTVARDDGCVNRFGEGDVYRVVCADVVPQLPRASEQNDMGVTMKIEVDEIRYRFAGTAGSDFTGPHETSQALNDLDVQEVRRVKFVLVAKEAGLDSRAKGGLQEELQ